VVIKKKSRSDPKLWVNRVIQARMKGISIEVITTRAELFDSVTHGLHSLKDHEEN
jgi:hypothetical protein